MINDFKNPKSETLRNCEAISRTKSRKSFGFLGVRNTKYALAFSLTEVLLALGTLAVGMLFIAAVFPASINLTTIATERTIAAAAADEAFAKIQLYGLNPVLLSYNTQVPFIIDYNDYAYPSTPAADPNSKRYWWSALCRKSSFDPLDRSVQVTVFICRKIGSAPGYLYRDSANTLNPIGRPVPVNMSVTLVAGAGDELQIIDLAPADSINERSFINDGCTIVENSSGHIYRVLERYANNNAIIKLDQPWLGLPADIVWVIPPPVVNTVVIGKYPCIAVYQKVIRF